MSIPINVLLVDDEPRFIDGLASILLHRNCRCSFAYSGKEAIARLSEGSFHVAFLDVELPDMSGCEIAAYIRKSHPEITSVMLTGNNNVETAVEAMKQGAYDFLSKPLKHDLFLKTLDKALQHNRLERQLKRSDQRFKILSEAAWEGIVIHFENQVIEANCQFLEMFGYREQDLEDGLRLDALLAPGAWDRLTLDLDDGLGGHHATVGLKKNGEEFSIQIKSRVLYYLDRLCRVWVVRDLTDRELAEKEKLELQKKLASANKLNALGLMAGSVAHDLNNILSGIVSYPDLLLMQMEESDKHYMQIKRIQEAGKRAAAVVSDLVAIARGGNQPKTVENLNSVVLNYLGSLEHGERMAKYPEVVLKTRLRRDIHNICCSPQHLHKVLLNLAGNALEAVRDNGVVTISTENCLFTHPLQFEWEGAHGNQFVRLTVTDNGPGIDPKHFDHIFDPFYTTKVMGKSGTGLGLSIVWKIIQDHKGWIEVKNCSPGAVFEVYLPATFEVSCPMPEVLENSLEIGQGEKILIIDDQAEQNEILENALNRLGYVTHSVTSGEEGIAYLRQEKVDLVLMDMIMGNGLNGRETLEIILKNNPRQRAIVVSGYAKSEEMEKTRQLGILSFLEKPVTLAKISQAIRNALVRV